MNKYTDLIKKHGSLDEFTSAVENTFDDGFCTWEEKEKAIKEYQLELRASLRNKHSNPEDPIKDN